MVNDAVTLDFGYDGIGFQIDIEASEQIISSEIRSTGAWEVNQLCLYRSLLPAQGVFVDVGANVGVNSIYASLSTPGARVIAVEPSPKNHELLMRNVSRAGLHEMTVLNLAIADKDGQIGFAGTGTNAHLSPTAADGVIEVPCRSLDSLADALHLARIDLLKIDVEGYTDMVLSRAEDTLARTRHAIVEFSFGDIVSRLATSGQAAAHADALRHSEQLFDVLRRHFHFFYYISRSAGLVELSATRDLFPIMFSEARVGDILATREPMPGAQTALSFAFESILTLKRENHLRILEIQGLRAKD